MVAWISISRLIAALASGIGNGVRWLQTGRSHNNDVANHLQKFECKPVADCDPLRGFRPNAWPSGLVLHKSKKAAGAPWACSAFCVVGARPAGGASAS